MSFGGFILGATVYAWKSKHREPNARDGQAPAEVRQWKQEAERCLERNQPLPALPQNYRIFPAEMDLAAHELESGSLTISFLDEQQALNKP